MADPQNGPPQQVSAPIGCLALLLTLVSVSIVLFGSIRVAHQVLQRPVISSLYGSQAYASGLRVVGRQGQLSDGRRLSSGWNFALSFGAFLLSIPAWVGYCMILAHFGLFPPDRLFEKKRRQRSTTNPATTTTGRPTSNQS